MFGLKVDLSKRYPGLDLARAIAIALVLFSHTLWISDFYPSSISYLMQLSGTIGVEIFFVISGFLIGKIVLKLVEDENFSFSTILFFLKRRWFRTLPNYYLILVMNVLLWFLIYDEIPEKLYLYFFYLQNLTTTSPDFYRISWSLAVEQFSYIVGPILLLITVTIIPNIKRHVAFLGISVLMLFLFFSSRIYFNSTKELASFFEWNETLRKVSIYRLDAIYYGFILYYLYAKNYIKESWYKVLFYFGIVCILILHVFLFSIGIQIQSAQTFFTVFYLPLNSIAICALIPFLMQVRFKENLFLRIVTTLSLISYSIYLLHYSIILHAMKVLFPSEQLVGVSLYGYTILYWFLVLISSYVLYRFFEKPITDLRD